MNTIVAGRDAKGPWQMLTWKQGIFSDSIPRKFNGIKRVWMELRTTVLWALWIERNDMVFNNARWPTEKLLQHVWSGMLDYGRVEWDKAKIKEKSHPSTPRVLVTKFFAKRSRNEVFARKVDGQPQWQLSGPMAGFVFVPP